MKTLATAFLFICLLTSFHGSKAVNVIIIESQSYISGQNMDMIWQGVCNGLGYASTVNPQTTLDVNTWFGTTDFLIVSSGTIALTPARINTIQSYLQQGGRVYLESEYDCGNFDSNAAFEQIVNALGGSFNWQGISSGTLAPMNASGSLSTTPNTVTPLTYFWWGCRGTWNSCNSHIEPFLEWNGLYFGFIFCVPGSSTARMITTSDQDWVLNSTSIPLMQNIAINLATPAYSCAVSGTSLSVNLGNDISICNPQTIVLNGTTAGAVSYLWSTGATSSSISVNTTGNYWVNVSAGSCSSSDSIQVNFGTTGILNLGADTFICSPNTLLLDASTAGATYSWQDNSTSAIYNVSQSGEYSVTVSHSGCDIKDTINVSVVSLPAISIAANDTAFCVNDSTQICVASGFAGYVWNNGANASCITTSITGSYYVTVTDNNGCSAESNHISTTVNPLPVANITADTTVICASGPAHICAAAGFGNYLWNTGEDTSCISTSLAGSYYVTVTDNNGCTAESNHISTTVNPLPVANITADTTLICASGTAHICAAAGFGNYLWNTGEDTSCISTSLAGNYYVTVTDNNGCTAESNHLAITVFPQPPVSISVNGDTLTAYNAVTYQWYLNGSAINSATSNIYIATQGGSYTVAVTDSNGCLATSSPVIITGIDNISEEDVVSVYPNPSQNSWQLTVGGNLLGGTAEVFDADGRSVFKSEIRNPKSEIATIVAKGVYLLRISSSKSSLVRKLIKL